MTIKKINVFLKKKKLTKVSFAKRIGVSYPHLCAVIAGKYKVSLKMAKSIEAETKGEISASELLDLK